MITTTGLEIVSSTNVTIGGIAQTNSFNTAFRIWYDQAADAIWARAEIKYSGPNPPAPLTGFIVISIWNPLEQLVDRSVPTPGVAEEDPVRVPALAHPMPGTWRGTASFTYRIEGDPVPRYLGDLHDSAFVASSGCAPGQCNVTLAPEESGLVLDGTTPQSFTATAQFPNPGPTYVWGYSKPPGSGTIGSVQYTGQGPNVVAKATWFPISLDPCLVGEPVYHPQYTVFVNIIGGSTTGVGTAPLRVKMPWGVPSSEGGTGYEAGATFHPFVSGMNNVATDVATYCPPAPTVANPCRVTGSGGLVREPAFVCLPDTPGPHDPDCDTLLAEAAPHGGLMPKTSSFRHKAEVHEGAHVSQYAPGGLDGDLWQVDGYPGALMNFSKPGGPMLRNLTALTKADLEARIDEIEVAWLAEQRRLHNLHKKHSELLARQVAENVDPKYIFQVCTCPPDQCE